MEQPRYMREAEAIVNTFDGIHNIGYHTQLMSRRDQAKLADEVARKLDRSQDVINYFQVRIEQAFAIGGNSFMASISGEGKAYKIRIFPTRINALRRMSNHQEQYITEICSDPAQNENFGQTFSSDPLPDEF